MTIYFESDEATVHHGDCLDVLATLPDASVDAVVTDPPYGLANTDPRHVAETITRWVNGERDYLPGGRGFMGKEWDAFVPPVAVWDECMRVLKPGGHALVFAGSRTVDLMTLGLRLAGFDIRDSIAWLYGSGFPKSMDVAKAIESHVTHGGSSSRMLKATELAGDGTPYAAIGKNNGIMGATVATERKTFAAASDGARAWEGWGTALKPAFEPIVVARKPLAGTVAANVLLHGTGALNVDATRIATTDDLNGGAYTERGSVSGSLNESGMNVLGAKAHGDYVQPSGRHPANVVLDESQAAVLDAQSGVLTSGLMRAGTRAQSSGGVIYGRQQEHVKSSDTYGDSGGASRFFYTAKAGADERPNVNGVQHPTVKPLDLMRWLVRLVTPRGGVVLEPFAGSGTTVEAAVSEGFRCIAVEREAEYLPLIESRLVKPIAQSLFGDWDQDGAA